MTNQNLLETILDDWQKIAEVITSGAAWEIWMQVELMFRLKRHGLSVAREVKYPAPYGNLSLDLLARENQSFYAIELKVESAHNAGRTLLVYTRQDILKIANYRERQTTLFVASIAYSDEAKSSFREFQRVNQNQAIYKEAGPIGALVVTAQMNLMDEEELVGQTGVSDLRGMPDGTRKMSTSSL